MDFLNLKDKKILVTGASSGIGRETAVSLSKYGARVVLCGRDEEKMKETLNSMESPEKHIVCSFDVVDYASYDSIFEKIVSDGIKLDGMVHCAGISKAIPLRVISNEEVMRILDVNYVSFLELAKHYTKKKNSNGGSIVAVSAANAHYPQKCMSVYAASKSALEASVKTLALELSSKNTRINCVIPGAVDTPMAGKLNSATLAEITNKQLLGLGKAENVSNVILFLLSDASSFITGRALYADGGMLGQ